MPKIVDHDEVRVTLAEAYGRVIASKGFAAASMRAVAREAGCSPSLPLHYFESSTELMTFSFEHQANKLVNAIEMIATSEQTISLRLRSAILLLTTNAKSDSASWRSAIDLMVKAEPGSRIAEIDRSTYLAVLRALEALFIEFAASTKMPLNAKTEAAIVLTSADGLALASVTLHEDIDTLVELVSGRFLSSYGLNMA